MNSAKRIARLKSVLFLTLLVGIITGIPSAIVPSLQQDTFGNSSSFVVTGLIGAGKGSLQFIYNPVIGHFSDLHGRKICLLLTLGASCIPYISMVLTNDFWVYALTDMVFGMYGATLTLLMAHVSDLIPIETGVRTESYAVCLAVFMLGVGGSTFIGVSLDTLVTFGVCAGAQTVVLILSYVLLPKGTVTTTTTTEESGLLQADGSAAAAPAGATDGATSRCRCPVTTLFATTKDVVKSVWYAIRDHRNLRYLSAIVFWNYLTQETLEQLLLLYLQDTLDMGNTGQAIVIAVMSGASLLCLVVVIGFMKDWFGTLGTLRVALVANFLISLGYAFAKTRWEAIAIPILSTVGMAVFPCTCSIAASSVSEARAGLVQGIATGSRVIAGAICPGLFGLLFQATENWVFPGMPFVVAAACVLVAFVLTIPIDVESLRAEHALTAPTGSDDGEATVGNTPTKEVPTVPSNEQHAVPVVAG